MQRAHSQIQLFGIDGTKLAMLSLKSHYSVLMSANVIGMNSNVIKVSDEDGVMIPESLDRDKISNIQ